MVKTKEIYNDIDIMAIDNNYRADKRVEMTQVYLCIVVKVPCYATMGDPCSV